MTTCAGVLCTCELRAASQKQSSGSVTGELHGKQEDADRDEGERLRYFENLIGVAGWGTRMRKLGAPCLTTLLALTEGDVEARAIS